MQDLAIVGPLDAGAGHLVETGLASLGVNKGGGKDYPCSSAPRPRTAAQDRDIVALLQTGALEAAFQRTLARYQDKVYRLCCTLLRDPTAAEDAAQESLVRIWKAMGSYDGRASLSTWIYAITRNRCLSALARRRELASLSDDADGRPRRKPWQQSHGSSWTMASRSAGPVRQLA